MSKDRREIVRFFSKRHICIFDNVSGISSEISDEICRAVTGGGSVARKLYTDDDELVYKYMPCIVINGINTVATRPDLLDRCIPFGLKPIKKTERKPQKKIETEFEAEKPRLLETIYEVLSKAQEIYPSVKLESLCRMADFEEFGYAIAEAIEEGAGPRFLEEYRQNRLRQNDFAIENSPVAECIIRFMKDCPRWEGSASELLKQVRRLADELELDKLSPVFPKGPQALTRRLNEIIGNLGKVGIIVRVGRISDARIIFLENQELLKQVEALTEDELPF